MLRSNTRFIVNSLERLLTPLTQGTVWRRPWRPDLISIIAEQEISIVGESLFRSSRSGVPHGIPTYSLVLIVDIQHKWQFHETGQSFSPLGGSAHTLARHRPVRRDFQVWRDHDCTESIACADVEREGRWTVRCCMLSCCRLGLIQHTMDVRYGTPK